MEKLKLLGALMALVVHADDFDLSTWPATDVPCAVYIDTTYYWQSAFAAIESYSLTYTGGSASAEITKMADGMAFNFMGTIGLYSASYNYCGNYFGGNIYVKVSDET